MNKIRMKKFALLTTMLFLFTLIAWFPAVADTTYCGKCTSVDFMAGQHHNAGSITACNDDSSLYVSFNTTGGWCMEETHLYVGTTPPTNSAPGQLEYKHGNLNCSTSDTYTIPLDNSWTPGTTIYIAAHGVVKNTVGEAVYKESAWSYGTSFGNNWAMYFTHTIQGCTSDLVPNINIVKSADHETASYGDTIKYTYVIRAC